jgi:predicted transcriptional regulator
VDEPHDSSLDALLPLDGEVFVIDPSGNHWVKFEVKRVASSPERPHGLRYSLTLHDGKGERLVGFDNAHPMTSGSGPGAKQAAAFDHKHRLRTIRPLRIRRCRKPVGRFLDRSRSGAGAARSKAMTTLKIGIASPADYKARTMAIARGELKQSAQGPKVWFTSIESLAKVLSDRNRELLALIAKEKPESLQALVERTGRAKSNLSRTLKTMERYGLVRFEKRPNRALAPRVNYDDIRLDLSLRAQAA